MFNTDVFYVFVVATLLQVFSLYQIFYHRTTIERKNIKLIQFYLDAKFVLKCVNGSIASSSALDAAYLLIDYIKDYYGFEDIITLNLKIASPISINSNLTSNVIEYVGKIRNRINDGLRLNNFFIDSFSYNNNIYNLYISSCKNKSNDLRNDTGLIIGIDRNPEKLSEKDITSLESSINLLKLNISYSEPNYYR